MNTSCLKGLFADERLSFETLKCFQIKDLVLGWEMEPRRTSDSRGEEQAWSGSGLVLSADLWAEVTESGSWFGRTFQ